jgi:cell division protease FtsH
LETSHLGDVLAAMNATFEQAKESAPCILFIDEVDNIGNRGSSDRAYDDYWSSLVNRMLELLDGASKTEGVIVIGATNRPDKIDPALLRSGRLERHIVIPPPDTAALVSDYCPSSRR